MCIFVYTMDDLYYGQPKTRKNKDVSYLPYIGKRKVTENTIRKKPVRISVDTQRKNELSRVGAVEQSLF